MRDCARAHYCFPLYRGLCRRGRLYFSKTQSQSYITGLLLCCNLPFIRCVCSQFRFPTLCFGQMARNVSRHWGAVKAPNVLLIVLLARRISTISIASWVTERFINQKQAAKHVPSCRLESQETERGIYQCGSAERMIIQRLASEGMSCGNQFKPVIPV